MCLNDSVKDTNKFNVWQIMTIKHVLFVIL